jgi:adenosylcobinamide-GDP ribazoletransferase
MMVPATTLAGYARREGLGSSVAAGAGGGEVSAALATALLLGIVGGWAGLLALVMAAALGTALLLGMVGGWAGLLALVLAIAAAFGFLFYMTRRVGGYTGDGLGAMAQLGETAAMLVLAGAWA